MNHYWRRERILQWTNLNRTIWNSRQGSDFFFLSPWIVTAETISMVLIAVHKLNQPPCLKNFLVFAGKHHQWWLFQQSSFLVNYSDKLTTSCFRRNFNLPDIIPLGYIADTYGNQKKNYEWTCFPCHTEK